MPTDAAEFHEEATAEYDAAFDWYLERSPDAALRFDAEVDRALAQIIAAPRRWAAGFTLTWWWPCRDGLYQIFDLPGTISSGDIVIPAVWLTAGSRFAGRSGCSLARRCAFRQTADSSCLAALAL